MFHWRIFFALLKCLARNVTLSPSAHFSLTGAQVMEAEYVMEIVVKNLPHPAQFRPSGTWFITDAAQYGWSAICVRNGREFRQSQVCGVIRRGNFHINVQRGDGLWLLHFVDGGPATFGEVYAIVDSMVVHDWH